MVCLLGVNMFWDAAEVFWAVVFRNVEVVVPVDFSATVFQRNKNCGAF